MAIGLEITCCLSFVIRIVLDPAIFVLVLLVRVPSVRCRCVGLVLVQCGLVVFSGPCGLEVLCVCWLCLLGFVYESVVFCCSRYIALTFLIS
jgi:hypothetical protein